MTSVVLDASAALAWMLKSLATPAATAFLEGGDDWTFEVPPIFAWEVLNVLLTLERRGSLSKAAYEQALAIYGRLDLRTSAPIIGMDNLAALARRTRLSLFDAAYLATVEGKIAARAEIEELAWIDPAAPGDVVLAPLMRVVIAALPA